MVLALRLKRCRQRGPCRNWRRVRIRCGRGEVVVDVREVRGVLVEWVVVER